MPQGGEQSRDQGLSQALMKSMTACRGIISEAPFGLSPSKPFDKLSANGFVQLHQSALAPDALMIGAQRARSALFISAICSGVLPMMT